MLLVVSNRPARSSDVPVSPTSSLEVPRALNFCKGPVGKMLREQAVHRFGEILRQRDNNTVEEGLEINSVYSVFYALLCIMFWCFLD